jgi:hypothetical protein
MNRHLENKRALVPIKRLDRELGDSYSFKTCAFVIVPIFIVSTNAQVSLRFPDLSVCPQFPQL